MAARDPEHHARAVTKPAREFAIGDEDLGGQ
jgi:hypothetical protein